MTLYNTELNNAFQSKRILKIITGINNTNLNNIIKIAKAANLSQATYLDVVANVNLVKILKSFSKLPICVSSINPIDLYNCVLAGADLVEVGNYDFFYNKGIYLTAAEVLNLTLEVKSLIQNIDICVTIPYHISLFEQISLSKELELIGITLIQTEGISRFYTPDLMISTVSTLNSVDTSVPSLLSTYFLSQSVNIPIIASSGFNNITAPMAYQYGASGIGIGASIQSHSSITSISKYINQTYQLMNSTCKLKANSCESSII